MNKMKCDTCGRPVNLDTDPIFKKHNARYYVEHVFLSHPVKDAIRIVQGHIDRFYS
jgi:hypothetical protein